jgi:HEAT repeat protein
LRLLLGLALVGADAGLLAGEPVVQLGRPEPARGARPVVSPVVFLAQPTPSKDKNFPSVENIITQEGSRVDNPELKRNVKQLLASGSPDTQVAVASILAEAGAAARKQRLLTRYPTLWMSDLHPELSDLAQNSPNPGVRRAALLALASLQHYPPVNVARIARSLQNPGQDPATMRGAAEALTELARTLGYLHENAPRVLDEPNEQEREKRTGWWDAFQAARIELVRASAEGLTNPDPHVQRQAIDTLQIIANQVVSRKEDRFFGREASNAVMRQRYAPLFEALQAAAPTMVQAATSSPDPRIRLAALQVLETLAKLKKAFTTVVQSSPDHRNLEASLTTALPTVSPPLGNRGNDYHAPPETLPGDDFTPTSTTTSLQPPPDPVAQALQQHLEELTRGLRDPNVLVRRRAVDVLETMGKDAAPAIPALVAALSDRDGFVRWAAARALGLLAPAQPDLVVPALTGLLCEHDIDIRNVSALGLARYGPDALPAVDALARAIVQSDGEFRILGIRAIKAIGEEATAAVDALIANLSYPNAQIRQAAAETLGGLKGNASAAIPALRKLLQDEDEAVRGAAADALLRITTGK